MLQGLNVGHFKTPQETSLWQAVHAPFVLITTNPSVARSFSHPQAPDMRHHSCFRDEKLDAQMHPWHKRPGSGRAAI